MASRRDGIRPRTFYLNETHELSSEDKEGGGRPAEYVGISWARKAKRISSSISKVIEEVESSQDPLREERFFVLAKPVTAIEKKNKDKRKAPDGTFKEPTEFGGAHEHKNDQQEKEQHQETREKKAVVH